MPFRSCSNFLLLFFTYFTWIHQYSTNKCILYRKILSQLTLLTGKLNSSSFGFINKTIFFFKWLMPWRLSYLYSMFFFFFHFIFIIYIKCMLSYLCHIFFSQQKWNVNKCSVFIKSRIQHVNYYTNVLLNLST